MAEVVPWEAQGSDGWSSFLEGTAERAPLPFFEKTMSWAGQSADGDRLAIDLGCGGGAETLELLARGWRVFATDGSPSAERLLRDRVDPESATRLTIEIGKFEDVELPHADLVFAQMSLPFAGRNLNMAASDAVGAVKPRGVFAGHFFGPNDEWIDDENVAAVDRAWIENLFEGWSEISIEETDAEGPFGLEGKTKHWHYYFVLARR